MSTTSVSETELTPDLIEQVKKLSPESLDKLRDLIDRAAPIPGPPPVGDAAYWKAEILRRSEAVENGTMKTYTLEETLERLQRVVDEESPS